MFWLSYESFSILCDTFLLKSVISSHITALVSFVLMRQTRNNILKHSWCKQLQCNKYAMDPSDGL